MLIVMTAGATEEQVKLVAEEIQRLGLKAHPIPGAQRVAIGITGNRDVVNPASRSPTPTSWSAARPSLRTA